MEIKDVTLTCSECGYQESDTTDRALMAKVRMFNHVSVEHPALIDHFREVVEPQQPAPGEPRRVAR